MSQCPSCTEKKWTYIRGGFYFHLSKAEQGALVCSSQFLGPQCGLDYSVTIPLHETPALKTTHHPHIKKMLKKMHNHHLK